MHEKFRYSQLVDLVASESGTSKQLIHETFVELVKEIKADLQKEGRVHLAGFGTFRLKWSEARQGRNPQTGEAISVAAHNRILFKPDAPIRRLINREYEQLKHTILVEKSEKKTATLTEELEAAATFSQPPLPLKPRVTSGPIKASEPQKSAPEKPPPVSPAPPIQSPVSPEPLKESERPVTVKVVREEQPPTVQKTPPQEEKTKKKIPLWVWIIPLFVIILLLFLFWPSADKAEPPEAENQAAETVTAQPAQETTTKAAPESPQPAGTPGGTHLVKTGDNLWGISTVYYKDAFLWPNILRVNLLTVKNPDFLKNNLQIEVPALQGINGNWTSHDLEEIAEGYIHAYLLYHNRDKKNAIHYLWVARNANATVYNKFKNQIDQADHTAILAIKGRSRY
jgi:DNA-binding protein HU-beta